MASSDIYLITGNPGIGKTTFILHLRDYLEKKYRIIGFYTEEIQHNGRRTGFNIRTFQGIKKIFLTQKKDTSFS